MRYVQLLFSNLANTSRAVHQQGNGIKRSNKGMVRAYDASGKN